MSFTSLCTALWLLGVLWFPAPVDDQDVAAKAAGRALPWMVRIADEAPVVAASFHDGALSILHSKTGETLKSIADPLPGAEIWRLDLDASGDLVALLTRDGRVWLWRWRDDEAPTVAATLPSESSSVDPAESPSEGTARYRHRFGAALEFDPKGQHLLAGHGQGGALLLDRTGKTVASFLAEDGVPRDGEPEGQQRVSYRATGLAHGWSKSGKRFALVTSQGPCVFRTADGAMIVSGFLTKDAVVESVALNKDGTKLATGHYGGTISLHNVMTRAKLWTFTHQCPFFGAHDGEWTVLGIGAMRFSPDDSMLAATSTTGICGILLDPTTGAPLWSGAHSGGRMGEPAAIAWLPSGKGFFFSFVSGVMPIEHVRILGAKNDWFAGQLRRERGTLPDVGWEGIGVYATTEAICAVEATTFRSLWRR